MKEVRIALRNVDKIDPLNIEDYIALDGYKALDMAYKTNREELIGEVERSGRLRGRGGAGFSTGFKWRSAYNEQNDKKYVICNADEGEVGTYKDRIILENDPHTLLEGMAICAYAIGADEAIIYCRAEYPNCISILKHAIRQAEEKNLFSGVQFSVRSGAGAYVCGEETALLNSLEGKRGEPRLKPPYPTVSGYNAKPTVVNNVETFSAIPVIVLKGAKWYGSIGSERYPGTKIFTLSGDVVNKSYFEVSSSCTLRQVIYDLGGGIPNGEKLKAVQVGGNSGAFLTEDQLDTPIDLESVASIGAALGSGSLFVLDETRDLFVTVVSNIKFCKHESCGKCTPCREGNLQLLHILQKIKCGKSEEKDFAAIKSLSSLMMNAAFCPLGQGAPTPLLSALEQFPEDFQKKEVTA